MRAFDAPTGVMHPADRWDMFYDGGWTSTANTTFNDALAATSWTRRRGVSMPADITYDPASRPLSGPAGRRRAGILGCVRQWGSLTVEQAATILGIPVSTAKTYSRALFRAGLVQFGSAGGNAWAERDIEPQSVLRAAARKRTDPHLSDLTPPTRVSVTGGESWSRNSASARHNALTVELALRASSLLDVPLVMGEQFATIDHLFGTGAGRDASYIPEREKSKAGDAVLVRADGVRVVIETTATETRGLDAKISAWADRLQRNPRSGVVVVFLVAPPVDADKDPTSKVAQFIANASDISYGSRERMLLARWEDWFPTEGCIDESFFSMAASTVTRTADRSITYREHGLLEMEVPGGSTGVLRHAGVLSGVPWWQRRPDVDPVSAMLAPYGPVASSASRVFGPAKWPELVRPAGRTADE